LRAHGADIGLNFVPGKGRRPFESFALMADIPITAGLLIIGDEILSGRTRDANIAIVAGFLEDRGIDLREVRIVRDDLEAIIAAVNVLRKGYSAVITTGGIGPTHDDITAEAIAGAFSVALIEDERAVSALRERYGDEALVPARLRMARIPIGAELIANSVSAAPGFSIGNVHVLAGVPQIMAAMLAGIAVRIGQGVRVKSRTFAVPAGEGLFAAPLAILQKTFPGVSIGSYPKMGPSGYRSEIVLRSRDVDLLGNAAVAVEAMLTELTVDIVDDPDAKDAP
jgi:molybdenum cofactor synthesis domain-containing protein